MDQQQPHTTPGSSERFVIAHKTRLLRVLAVITVLALAAVAAFYILQQQEAVRQARQEVAELQSQLSLATLQTTKEGAPTVDRELSDESKISSAASNYYCSIPGFGCDKVVGEVTQIVTNDETDEAFAIVEALGTGGETTLYLKRGGGQIEWVVIYEGVGALPDEVADKFDVPAELL